jgi:hypothetical protein
MALATCRECNAKVSSWALSCPSCGAVTPQLRRPPQWAETLCVLFFIGIHALIKLIDDPPLAGYVFPAIFGALPWLIALMLTNMRKRTGQ